jgi:hypothetical protein
VTAAIKIRHITNGLVTLIPAKFAEQLSRSQSMPDRPVGRDFASNVSRVSVVLTAEFRS